MYFQIDPPGSDYTRVQIDVPKGQLEAVIRAVTAVEAEHAELERTVKSTLTAIQVVLEDEDHLTVAPVGFTRALEAVLPAR